jgi:SAM-dependent methyltransferase
MAETPMDRMEAELWAGPMGERWLAYRDQFESMIAQPGDALIAAAGFKPGERVLDVGCGGGANSLQIARHVAPSGSVTGLDISAALVGACQARARDAGIGNARFIVGDAGAAAVDGAPFDRMYSRFGVMFFADPYAAFAHLHGLLKPGGRLDFACWGPPDRNPWMLEMAGLMRRYAEGPPPAPRAPGPFAFAEPDYVREILERGGFKDVGVDPWQGEQFIGGQGADAKTATRFVLEGLAFADSLKELPEDTRKQAEAELADLMARHEGPKGVSMGSMVWMVSAAA